MSSVLSRDVAEPAHSGPIPTLPSRVLTRFATGILAAVTFAFVTISTLLAVTPPFEFSTQLCAVVPVVLIAAVLGVGQVLTWAPVGFALWRGWLGYLTAAPYAALMVTAVVAPEVLLPVWVAPATGALAAVPFVVAASRAPASAAGAVVDDGRGRTGALFASLALLLAAYGVLRPTLGIVIQMLLVVALAILSLAGRGLADAASTWNRRQWVALIWGCFAVWAGVPLQGMTNLAAVGWVTLGLVVVAALPLVWVSRR